MGGRAEEARTKRDRIVQELRRRVLTGEYPRGTWLRQDELALEFKTSITPIREALRILETERIAVAEPHKGVRVAGADIDRVEAIYVNRRLVESFAVQRATSRMSRRDLAAQQRILERMGILHGSDAIEVRDLNRAFHFGFYERSGLPELTTSIAALWDAFPWDLQLQDDQRLSRSHRDHEDILAAVVAGEAQHAAELMAGHIASGYAGLRIALIGENGPDPFDEE
ncbi:GntR family transcriptional regulator [Microbacterium trichothecenolyticum]|uniref:GntR family transcriptional regulator n=1 Tax=Microbacterium trichothecenolyticum TaxID=69370 RepID=UPI001C6DDD66|nr:GntR family transcriptional regulator [Microbacterium trichothecenolyticum]MBW9122316.1 GntR family transcriptional regulator [Microbacterium trichothecenolyticum]